MDPSQSSNHHSGSDSLRQQDADNNDQAAEFDGMELGLDHAQLTYDSGASSYSGSDYRFVGRPLEGAVLEQIHGIAHDAGSDESDNLPPPDIVPGSNPPLVRSHAVMFGALNQTVTGLDIRVDHLRPIVAGLSPMHRNQLFDDYIARAENITDLAMFATLFTQLPAQLDRERAVEALCDKLAEHFQGSGDETLSHQRVSEFIVALWNGGADGDEAARQQGRRLGHELLLSIADVAEEDWVDTITSIEDALPVDHPCRQTYPVFHLAGLQRSCDAVQEMDATLELVQAYCQTERFCTGSPRREVEIMGNLCEGMLKYLPFALSDQAFDSIFAPPFYDSELTNAFSAFANRREEVLRAWDNPSEEMVTFLMRRLELQAPRIRSLVHAPWKLRTMVPGEGLSLSFSMWLQSQAGEIERSHEIYSEWPLQQVSPLLLAASALEGGYPLKAGLRLYPHLTDVQKRLFGLAFDSAKITGTPGVVEMLSTWPPNRLRSFLSTLPIACYRDLVVRASDEETALLLAASRVANEAAASGRAPDDETVMRLMIDLNRRQRNPFLGCLADPEFRQGELQASSPLFSRSALSQLRLNAAAAVQRVQALQATANEAVADGSLPGWFWQVFNEDLRRHLGIPSGQALELIGLRTAEDLQVLGISEDMIRDCTQLQREIENVVDTVRRWATIPAGDRAGEDPTMHYSFLFSPGTEVDSPAAQGKIELFVRLLQYVDLSDQNFQQEFTTAIAAVRERLDEIEGRGSTQQAQRARPDPSFVQRAQGEYRAALNDGLRSLKVRSVASALAKYGALPTLEFAVRDAEQLRGSAVTVEFVDLITAGGGAIDPAGALQLRSEYPPEADGPVPRRVIGWLVLMRSWAELRAGRGTDQITSLSRLVSVRDHANDPIVLALAPPTPNEPFSGEGRKRKH